MLTSADNADTVADRLPVHLRAEYSRQCATLSVEYSPIFCRINRECDEKCAALWEDFKARQDPTKPQSPSAWRTYFCQRDGILAEYQRLRFNLLTIYRGRRDAIFFSLYNSEELK